MNVVDIRVVLKFIHCLAPLSFSVTQRRRCVTEREGPELDCLNNKKVDGFFGH